MEIKKCKKCGGILPSDSKKKLCESCRLRRNSKIKKGFIIAAGAIVTALTAVASVAGIKKNKQ